MKTTLSRTLIPRVKRRREHLDAGIGGEADRVKLQRARRLVSGGDGEPPVLVQQGNDWLGEADQADGGGDRQEERQPQGSGQGAPKGLVIAPGRAFADQRQGHRRNGYPEDAQGELHQAERVVEPGTRAVLEVAGERGVDHDVDLHRARGDNRRAHQAQDGPHALVAPLEVWHETVARPVQAGKLHDQLQQAAQERAARQPVERLHRD